MARHRNTYPKQFVFVQQYLMDKDGHIIIDITVKDDTHFLSVFSENGIPIISSEVANFLEERTIAVPRREALSLHIHSDCIDEMEKEQYRGGIAEYYRKRYVANGLELQRNNLTALILAFLGTFVLVGKYCFTYFTFSLVLSEVVDIIAWVLLWEALDIFIFRNKALRLKQERYYAYRNMKIVYEPITEKDTL